MAFGTLKADTLTHSTAGSLTTDYVVNGSAKAFISFNGTGTVAIKGSMNVSTLADEATGGYQVNLASSMADTNYSSVSSAAFDTGTIGGDVSNTRPDATSSYDHVNSLCSTNTRRDAEFNQSAVNGDLA
jgi:hypothetical protein